MTTTGMKARFEIERGKWGWYVVINGEEIEGFDTKGDAQKFIKDFEHGDYHGSEYAERVAKAESR